MIVRKLLLVILISSLFVAKGQSLNGYSDVTVMEAKIMVDTNMQLVVLDVRTLAEYDSGHIRNSRLIPHTELESRLAELNVSDEILVYCGSGGRSATASQILVDNGFLHVYNMLGGTTAWTAEGYPIYVKYSSIQLAVNNAQEGDTLYVASGIYYEHVEVNKSLSLIGESQESTVVDGTSNGTIFKITADNVLVAHFAMRYCGCACEGYYAVDIEKYCQNVSIRHNHLTFNGLGIRLDWTHRVFITDNNITRNNSLGISISNSSDIWVLRNHILEDLGGIKVENSTNIVVVGNTVHDSLIGISIGDTDHGILSGNAFTSNRFGGMYIVQSNNHSIFHNNFIQNAHQVYSLNSKNFWDNGLEGNYWSSYGGVDSNHDGVGDSRLEIDANNTDRYPLMGSFHNFNTSLGHLINIISNSTVTDFEACQPCNLLSMYVSNVTTNQTRGFARVTIPKSFTPPPYVVVINDGLTEVLHFNGTIHSNDTHTWIYFAYEHSTHAIEITPEFPLLILPLFMTSTLLATVLCRKRER